MNAADKSMREVLVEISGMDADGLGMAVVDERPLRVRNALPGEMVSARIVRKRKGLRFADGQLVEQAHPDRQPSACALFPRCGGCTYHHVHHDAQLSLKEGYLRQQLEQAGVTARAWLPPERAATSGYRRKARLGVRVVGEQVLIGFRESFSNRVARMDECAILTPLLSRLLPVLKSTVAQMSAPHSVPQIEVAQGEDFASVIVRHLAPLSEADSALWDGLAQQHAVQVLLQSGGYETLLRHDGERPRTMTYELPNPVQDGTAPLVAPLVMSFHAHQFTQVNFELNRKLVAAVVGYAHAAGTIADFFCGIGNFTLPLAAAQGGSARSPRQVYGYEVGADAINMAQSNALSAGLTAQISFTVADLYTQALPLPTVDCLVLDPPRSGAGPHLEQWLHQTDCGSIVYVSCNPKTFASDAKRITNQGFTLDEVRIFDMFPHTNHVETLGNFVKR